MKIGKHCIINGHIETARDDIITIGDHVVLGGNSVIITHCPISFYNGEKSDIVIGNNVYIGTRCIVLPGVTIGDNVVIGAGSVVSRDIPSDVIAAGNPCKVIKELPAGEALRIKLMTEQEIVADGARPNYNIEYHEDGNCDG